MSKSDLYEHKEPPRATLAVDSAEVEPLCPMSRQGCMGKNCLFWDEDYDLCAMSPLSFYNQIRDAVTDAAVELIRAYGDDLK